MSFAVDTNLLLYAVNQDSEFHQSAKKFIETCAQKEESWMMPYPVVHAFLRISTHAAILPKPLTSSQSFDIVESILRLPHVVCIGEEGDLWKIYKEEVFSLHLKGNDFPDALIVSVLKVHGVSTFYTKDRGFLRFKNIKAIEPF